MKLSIIIPAYNEEKRIEKTLEEYYLFFSEKLGDDYEIVVILNGCRDKTLGIVDRLSNRRKNIRYKEFKEAIGKGGAIIEGFKTAEGELIGFVDADGATKPETFYELVKNINGFDGVVASRWIKGAIIKKKQPVSRRIASRGFNLLVRLLFMINLRDTQCGAKLFKKKAIKKIVPELGITQWAFDIDLLYRMKKNGFRVNEIPTEWGDIEGSRLNLKKTIPEMLLSIVRLRLIYSPFRFIVKLYDKSFYRK